MTRKFEATAEVGDLIKCYDFEPHPDRQDRYVVGRVLEKGFLTDFSIHGYRIAVLKDTVFTGEDMRDEVVTAFEMMFGEHDDRITKVETA